MTYLLLTGEGWSAPLTLGGNVGIDSQCFLAADAAGKVFAVWESSGNLIKGRWILPFSEVSGKSEFPK